MVETNTSLSYNIYFTARKTKHKNLNKKYIKNKVCMTVFRFCSLICFRFNDVFSGKKVLNNITEVSIIYVSSSVRSMLNLEAYESKSTSIEHKLDKTSNSSIKSEHNIVACFSKK